jgi:hypothetical protein
MELVRKQEPITLVCPLSRIDLASLIVDMFNISLEMQQQPRKVSALGDMALVVPARLMKSRLELEKSDYVDPQKIRSIADRPLLAFLRKSTLIWNRKPAVYIRCLMEGGIDGRFLSLVTWEEGFRPLYRTLD